MRRSIIALLLAAGTPATLMAEPVPARTPLPAPAAAPVSAPLAIPQAEVGASAPAISASMRPCVRNGSRVTVGI